MSDGATAKRLGIFSNNEEESIRSVEASGARSGVLQRLSKTVGEKVDVRGGSTAGHVHHQALDSRRAQRVLSRMIPLEVREKTKVDERALTLKMFESGLTPRENRRLQQLRWQLDRIEDAEHGHILDALERYAELQISLADQIGAFVQQAEQASKDWSAASGRAGKGVRR